MVPELRERLEYFIEKYGLKQWAIQARKDLEFIEWVDQKTAHLGDLTFPEKVYTAVYDDPPSCHQGGRRKLNSIVEGWRFCNRAAFCPCAAQSVRDSLKETLAKKPKEEVDEAKKKRAATNKAKYGHENVGQSAIAKKAHAAFYSDEEKVKATTEKGRRTMIATYGVDNALKLPKVVEGRKNHWLTMSTESKASISRLKREARDRGHFLTLSHAKLKEKFKKLGYEWHVQPEDYRGVYGETGRFKYPFSCDTCGLLFHDYIYDGFLPECKQCHPFVPTYVSKEETEVGDFVEGLGFRVVRSARGILKSYQELDIYIPDKRVAIEYCGLYWHSQYASETNGVYVKDSKFHIAKLRSCENDGIRLITIFSDEWVNNPDIVQSRLMHILGKESDRVYARQTVCRAISNDQAKRFLNLTHLQGAGTPAPVRYGLFHNDALVSVMTFGRPRVLNNHTKEDGGWELYRFASVGSVVGGASKLFRSFVRDHDPNIVRTFVDRRWGSGGVYAALGFEPDGFSPPSYWYVSEHYQKREHRYTYAKHTLVKEGFDASLSEAEIMRQRGFDIIWDCGNAKYVWRRQP